MLYYNFCTGMIILCVNHPNVLCIKFIYKCSVYIKFKTSNKLINLLGALLSPEMKHLQLLSVH